MKHRQLLILILSLITLALGAADVLYIASFWSEIRPQLSYFKQRMLETDPRFTEAVKNIAAHVQSVAHATESEKLDYIRNWIYRNSTHKSNVERPEYEAKTRIVLPMLWKTHLQSAPPPQLTCGPRAYAMKAILDEFGIKSRIVDLISNRRFLERGLRTHTFLEVWNKDTRSWEIQDPDYDISYQHVSSSKRAAVLEMVMGNINDTEPINRAGRGWHELKVSGLQSFFIAAVYRLNYEGRRSIAIINVNKIDPDARFFVDGVVMNISGFLKKYANDPLILDSGGITSREGSGIIPVK